MPIYRNIIEINAFLEIEIDAFLLDINLLYTSY